MVSRGSSVDTNTEAWRHETEVRHVANLPSNAARAHYLDGVELHRGEAAAERLRLGAWEILKAPA